MTDEQRSLAGYKSKVHEQGDFENPNDGKPLLNDTDEYVFRLAVFPIVKSFSVLKDRKDGTRATVKIDKAICDFIEESTGNVVNAFFRVDSLNFSEDESFESGIVRFFKKIKNPLTEGVEPDWTQYFLVGMRFRGRVVVAKGEDKLPNRKYYLDVPTCRPILPSDKHPDAVAAAQENAANENASSGTLANALLIAKGAKDFNSAMDALKAAGTSKEVAMALFNANMDGKITYPI